MSIWGGGSSASGPKRQMFRRDRRSGHRLGRHSVAPIGAPRSQPLEVPTRSGGSCHGLQKFKSEHERPLSWEHMWLAKLRIGHGRPTHGVLPRLGTQTMAHIDAGEGAAEVSPCWNFVGLYRRHPGA